MALRAVVMAKPSPTRAQTFSSQTHTVPCHPTPPCTPTLHHPSLVGGGLATRRREVEELAGSRPPSSYLHNDEEVEWKNDFESHLVDDDDFHEDEWRSATVLRLRVT